jgi:hypothetical protein
MKKRRVEEDKGGWRRIKESEEDTGDSRRIKEGGGGLRR